MTLWLLLWGAAALADDRWPVRAGETIETVAVALGDPRLADEIRRINGLAPTAQPVVGSSLILPPPQVPIHGLVLSVHGAGTVSRPGAPQAPLAPGQELPMGAQVCVGAEGLATLRLAILDGSDHHDDIHLMPGTCVSIERADATPGARRSLVDLRSGSVSVLPADGTPGTVTLRTPSGITTGQQGGFRVTVEPGAARTEAVEEPVAVLGAGVRVELGAGTGSRVRTGERPQTPVPLLLGGALLSPASGEALRRPDFTWRPTERALTYQVQVAADPGFRELMLIETVTEPAWRPELLQLDYASAAVWWRVLPVDRTDFVGVPASAHEVRWPTGVRAR